MSELVRRRSPTSSAGDGSVVGQVANNLTVLDDHRGIDREVVERRVGVELIAVLRELVPDGLVVKLVAVGAEFVENRARIQLRGDLAKELVSIVLR